MALERALDAAQAQVPGCVAIGYVDMSTGLLLAVKTVDSHPTEALDLVAVATADLFHGPNVTAIERLFENARGAPPDARRYFKEIVVISQNLIHVFLRGKRSSEHALVFVCRASANVGMVLARSRLALPSVEEAAS